MNVPAQIVSDGSGMSPYAELHSDGQFGVAGYNLLFVLVRQELRRFPGLQTATRDDDAVWDFVDCAENNPHVVIGNETYMMSADGYLMPTKPDQPPPDLRYFKARK